MNHPLENISLVEECQTQCQKDVECKSFLHQPSTQKCWLKQDNTFELQHEATYVGPKECPTENHNLAPQNLTSFCKG